MLFLYLDESGNYTFSYKGSEYLIYTSLTTTNPYLLYHELCELEKKLKKSGIILEQNRFHASEDKQIVRDEVYKILKKPDSYEVDAIIVEKCKANPSLRETTQLYKKIYGVLLKYILKRYTDVTKILIFIDESPEQKKKEAMKKGIKESLSVILNGRTDVVYRIVYLPSVFSYGLQAADYCCWALKKKYGEWGQKIDLRPYKEIGHSVKSEFDIFQTGTTKYYQPNP